MRVVTRAEPPIMGWARRVGDCGMGVEPCRDWSDHVQRVPDAGATLPMLHIFPISNKTSRAAKLLVLAAALGVTLIWIAFLFALVAPFFGCLF